MTSDRLLKIDIQKYLQLLCCYRLERLEESLRDEDMSEATKTEKRLQHAVKETEFLRLRRSRLGVDDFDPIKVIGRGAFGEVRTLAYLDFDLVTHIPQWTKNWEDAYGFHYTVPIGSKLIFQPFQPRFLAINRCPGNKIWGIFNWVFFFGKLSTAVP